MRRPSTLLLGLLLVACGLLAMVPAICLGALPGEPALFQSFDWGAGGEFAVEGTSDSTVTYFGTTTHEVKNLAVSPSRQMVTLISGSTSYYVRPNTTYVTAKYRDPNETVCYEVHGYGYFSLNPGFADVKYMDSEIIDGVLVYNFQGSAFDFGGGCVPIAYTVKTRPYPAWTPAGFKWLLIPYRVYFAQVHPDLQELFYYGGYNLTLPEDTNVVGKNDYESTHRAPTNADFELPAACKVVPLVTVDYVDFFYRRFGFCNETSGVQVPLTLFPWPRT